MTHDDIEPADESLASVRQSDSIKTEPTHPLPRQGTHDDSRQTSRPAVEGSVGEQEIGAVNALINAIRQFALAVSLVIWSILGFLFWIPMLIYSIVHFSALVVYATITDADPSSLATKLERAVRFYLQGFRNVIGAIYKSTNDRRDVEHLKIDLARIVIHVIGTFAFWLGLAALVLWLTGTLAQWF